MVAAGYGYMTAAAVGDPVQRGIVEALNGVGRSGAVEDIACYQQTVDHLPADFSGMPVQ